MNFLIKNTTVFAIFVVAFDVLVNVLRVAMPYRAVRHGHHRPRRHLLRALLIHSLHA